MNVEKVTFLNSAGETLTGRMEFPADQKPHQYAIFAHCFTCTKNLSAVVNISRALAQAGFGVLRFDFTGLGESEGDFAETNFSGNVEDLVDAARFLKEKYESPALLVGHSLGGSAVIFAAAQLDSVRAVATIGAPSDPAHVQRLLKDSREEIIKNGKATVNLEGREFTIKKQFLDDLESQNLTEIIHRFKKSLLILHSPQDMTVEIMNAEKLYKAARHPKSFITLDGADHLLSDKDDSRYVGEVIAGWASRYLRIPDKEKLRSHKKVAASLDHEEGFTTRLKLGNHSALADEPVSFGGKDFGPDPYAYVAGGLAACKVMTVQMYAKRKKWDLQNVTVHINHSREHRVDADLAGEESPKIDTFTCEISFAGNLSEEQRSRLLEISDRCPVHRTLTRDIQIISQLIK